MRLIPLGVGLAVAFAGVRPAAGTSPISWIVIMPSGRTVTVSCTSGSGRIVTASWSGAPTR